MIPSHASAATVPSLPSLLAALPQPLSLPTFDLIPGTAMPEPERSLLVHDEHMTVTMESFHGSRVSVRVQQCQRHGDWYARQIVLVKEGTNDIVQGGIVRIHLPLCSPEVRAAILREDTPLGRILIEHNVMRSIEISAYLRIVMNEAWGEWLACPGGATAYGRLGIIHCDQRPAIELFEIAKPRLVQ